MYRGEGPTANKFWKNIGTVTRIIEVGVAPHQKTIEDLKRGDYHVDWTDGEIREIIEAFDPEFTPEERADGLMTAKEVQDLLKQKEREWEAERYQREQEAKMEDVEAKPDLHSNLSAIDAFQETEKKNVSTPGKKRGPGRPRKSGGAADSA